MKTFVPMLGALALLAGCIESDTVSVPGPAGNAPEASASAACRAAVLKVTANPQVTVIGSEFSEAGTRVILGVGPQMARWQCIAYRDGSTDAVMSLTNEGRL